MFPKPSSLIAFALLGAAAGCPAADYSFFFTISNDVSTAEPSATVTVWAAFPDQLFAFGLSHTAVLGVPDAGSFFDPKVLIDQYYSCYPGDVSPDGDSILNIRFFQLQFIGGQFADTHNPLELWSATWTTDDFTPRKVPIWTRSTDFWIYLSGGGDWENFYGPDFSEAHDFIRVVPAPPVAALLAGAGLWFGRRKR